MSSKKNIRTIPEEQLAAFVADAGEKPFRVKQINTWLWHHAVRSFDEMTNLSLALREKMKETYEIRAIQIRDSFHSSDGTIKYSFALHDDHIIEGVLIPTHSRITACISSQVGCNLACKFCATGMIRYIRNLEFDEIFDQVAILNEESEEHFRKGLSNIVYMGMGEPLMNYHNVLKSAEYITHPDRLGMSPQRLTVSSVGIAPMIKQLGRDKVKFNFALSLHAPTDKKRGEIIPYNQRNSIADLTEAMTFFHEQTGTRPTIEYVMLKDFNDSLQDAQDLANFCKSFPVKVNLIQYNPVENSPYEDSGMERINAFKEFLEKKNMIVNVRRSRGKDIDAACGQLANKMIKDGRN
jgi:23S rRNA (adenine2503-C2)-methyltransferase